MERQIHTFIHDKFPDVISINKAFYPKSEVLNNGYILRWNEETL